MKSNAYQCAVRLLARREHGAHELVDKLIAKGYLAKESEDALLECQRLGLQCDQRFVESRFRVRIRQGYGPRRIQNELQQFQIDDVLIKQMLQQEAENWLEYGLEVWAKKYQENRAPSYVEQQKQKQFLHYRGFSSETIALIFREIK